MSARVMRQFSTREVKKEYLAIVHGVPSPDTGVVDAPLISNPSATDGELMYYPGADGKEVRFFFMIMHCVSIRYVH